MNSIIKEDCNTIFSIVNLAPFKNRAILLTGGTGFIGHYLVNLIDLANKTKNLNCSLTVASLHGAPKNLKFVNGKKIKFIKKDLSKPFKISGYFDYIIHAAGYGQPARFIERPLETIHINTCATEILLELARSCKAKFLFISSADTYGDIPKNIKSVPETFGGNLSTLGPRAVYGESKRLGETLCWVYKEKYGVDAKIVRASHLYGPGISIYDKRVLGDFLRGALKEKVIKLKDEGKAIKTFGYISDAIAMILFAALKGKDIVYNVGGISSISIRGLAEMIAKKTHSRVIVPKKKNQGKHIGSDPKITKLDFSRIRKEMKGFAFTPIQTGLRRTIAWNLSEFSKVINQK